MWWCVSDNNMCNLPWLIRLDDFNYDVVEIYDGDNQTFIFISRGKVPIFSEFLGLLSQCNTVQDKLHQKCTQLDSHLHIINSGIHIPNVF